MSAPAYQADGAPCAREAFYALACDPQRSAVVEACAGAGKTWMLVSRILRALLEGAQPHEILAITFTRKAAAEMRERLSDWLREFSAPGFTDEQRVHELVQRGMTPAQAHAHAAALPGLYEQLLASGRSVEIRTFHAWFSQLLRAAPLELLAELGMAPGMVVMEELDEHRAAVFRRFRRAVLANPGLRADHADLIRRRGRDQVQAWLDAALQKRAELELADDAGALESSVPPATLGPDPAAILSTAAWRSSLAKLALALGLGGSLARKAALLLTDALAETDAEALFRGVWQALFTDKGGARKLGKVDELDAIQGAVQDIAAQVEQQRAHAEHLQLVRLTRVLLKELAAYKRARGLADMSDLERCALALLRDASLSAWVQERLDTRIRHVLIDEFQDTSPLQWHAIHSWLSAYAGAGGGQSGQRPPDVFIVGDPKQSIYRFRRAEPKVFAAAREFVAQGLGGHWLACDHTRRNAPEVLEAVNQVFQAAQSAGEYADFRAHTTESAPRPGAGVFALPAVLRPGKESGVADAGDAEWRDSLGTPRHEPEAVLREKEAAWVALAIHELVRTGQAQPADVFVLCRKRASLRLAAQALQALHVPFAAAEDFSLMDAPEVRDLVAVLDALASPSHRLSLAHALRSPLFGAADDDLIALAHDALADGDWWRSLMQHAGRGDRPALQRAALLMQAWYVAAQRLPPHDLLDRIVFEGEYRERMAAVVPAERRLAALGAVDALLGQALLLDGARYATPYNFVRALKRRAIKVAAPLQPQAVQLLTVHGAKGLEARFVFVMDSQPEAAKADTATLLIDWPVESDRPNRCAFIYSEARCPPALRGLMDLELTARRREELNGLYVAMTRAKERLIFSRTEPHRVTPSWWQRVEALARPWEPAPVPATRGGSAPARIELRRLPDWPGLERARSSDERAIQRADDNDASRLGQAVHRVLEWASGPSGEGAGIDALSAAAAAEFSASVGEVSRVAGTIWRSAECQRFFAGPGLHWAGNEVPVAEAGEVLRIDRLVQLDEAGTSTWWVLDYKVATQPQEQAVYREQLLRYRRAVMAIQPGEVVRCALVNGKGNVIEVT